MLLKLLIITVWVSLSLFGHFSPNNKVSAAAIRRNASTANAFSDCPCQSCLFPNAENCKEYFLCLDYELHERECEPGELFNPVLENCDYEEKVHCPTETPPLDDFDCPEIEGLFPNPVDCGSFIQCSNRIPYIHKCPSKLHFSKELKRCEYPSVAKCRNDVPPTETNTTAFPVAEGMSCTGQNGMYAYPGNSSLYLQCEGWLPRTRCCPPNTVFNPTGWICTINKSPSNPVT